MSKLVLLSLWRVCGQNHHRNITVFIRKVNCGCFGVKLGDRGKSRATQKVCCVCVADLRERAKGKQKAFTFAVAVIWRGLIYHSDNRYFCCNNANSN
jgi:hypothetical protein